jgi:hypothetical protein
MGIDQLGIANQILQGVRKSLDLQHVDPGDRTAGADDRITWANE